jgi:hypothetical protein
VIRIANVCRSIARYGAQATPARLAADLWRRFERLEL